MLILRNIVLLFSTLITFFIFVTNHRISLQEGLLFEIKQGTSLQEVANELKNRDLILNHFFFILNAKIYNIDQTIKAGEYLLSDSESIFTLQKKFLEGDTFFRKLQLLEGMTVREIFELGNSEGIVDDINGDLEKFKLKLNIVGQAEGLLFPDTFYYQKGDLFSSLLKRAFNKQQTLYLDLWDSRQEDLPYSSLIEAITLASINSSSLRIILGCNLIRLGLNSPSDSDPYKGESS